MDVEVGQNVELRDHEFQEGWRKGKVRGKIAEVVDNSISTIIKIELLDRPKAEELFSIEFMNNHLN